MDFTKYFKEKGFKYRHVFALGNTKNPKSIQIVDSWVKELMDPKELEESKRTVMKNYKLPIIDIKIETI